MTAADVTGRTGQQAGAGSSWTWAPVAGFAGYLAAAAAQVVQSVSGNDGNQDGGDWVFSIGIATVVTVIAVTVARWAFGRSAGSTRVAAATFGALAALGIVVFWAGVPAILGAGAAGLALAERRATGSFSGPGLVGLVLGGAALVMSLVGLAGGW